LQRAQKAAGRAIDVAEQGNQQGRAALFETGAALWNAFFGNVSAARRGALEALERSKDRDVEYGVAFALAMSGDSSQAEAIASDLEKRFPEDTSVRFGYLPSIRALIAMNHGDPAKAIELLQSGARYDQGTPLCSAPPGFFGIFYPVYVRGLAFLAAHQGVAAAGEFQRILDHRTIVISDPIGALARLQLGRAFVLSGDTVKAKTAFEGFLALWKDADPDIPIFRQAMAEYASLP
jgi:hypothetical protein